MVRPWSPIWVVAAMATSSTRSGRQLRVAAQQLADAADHQVVGAGVGVHATGLAERGADAVDEDDVADFTGHWSLLFDRDCRHAAGGGTRRTRVAGTGVSPECYSPVTMARHHAAVWPTPTPARSGQRCGGRAGRLRPAPAEQQADLPLAGAVAAQRLRDRLRGDLVRRRPGQPADRVRGDQVLRRQPVLAGDAGSPPPGSGPAGPPPPGPARPSGAAGAARPTGGVTGSASSGSARASSSASSQVRASRRTDRPPNPGRASSVSLVLRVQLGRGDDRRVGQHPAGRGVAPGGDLVPGVPQGADPGLGPRAAHPVDAGGAPPRVGPRPRRAGRPRRPARRTPPRAHADLPCRSSSASSASRRSTSSSTSSAA